MVNIFNNFFHNLPQRQGLDNTSPSADSDPNETSIWSDSSLPGDDDLFSGATPFRIDNVAGGAESSTPGALDASVGALAAASSEFISLNNGSGSDLSGAAQSGAAVNTAAATSATPAQVQAAINDVGLSFTGSRLTVGVLSDSFNDLGGAAADEADGALPTAANVDVLADLSSGGSDEGRAMMQVVHDVASGAKLDFYTADNSEQNFASGILALAAAGCKVICDDVSYFDEPFFQTGVVANAIATVEKEGVMYVTCAGNQAAAAYQSSWTNIASATYDGQTLTNTLDFGGGAPVQTVAIGNDYQTYTPVILQWNQPYGSASSNLAMVVFSGGVYLGTVTNSGSGNPDIEVYLTSGYTYQIAIEDLSGPAPTLIKDMIYNDSDPSNVSLGGANAGTVLGHHMSPDAITVGAVDAANTPGNGGTLASENFSSSGAGTQLWYNYDGSAVTNGPLNLSPVAVSGVDGVNTTVSGGLSDFYGTSCATPTVAGVVALMLQANPDLTFARVETILEETATAFGDPAVAGAGLVNAALAVRLAAPRPDDFQGDGLSDILWKNTSGAVQIWDSNGSGGFTHVSEGSIVSGWTVAGVGDFNGDGSADILWRNTSGAAQIWESNGSGGFTTVSEGVVATSWTVAGVGDFNGDGSADILWRNTSGAVELWDSNGSGGFTHVSQQSVPSSWTVAGVGDFNGDGLSDILWRNATSGAVEIWDSNGSGGFTHVLQQSVPSTWTVAGIGDFNGDGLADILWRNTTSGAVQNWDSNGSGEFTHVSQGVVATSWSIQGA